jgi:segregation and condensation protein A
MVSHGMQNDCRISVILERTMPVQHEVHLEQFSGPLDLLLSLIEEKTLSLSEVSIAQVTEQYLERLDAMSQSDPEDIADFLVVASRLVLLKSRLLLPQFYSEEDEGPSLEEQLKLYKSFVAASKVIDDMWCSSSHASFRYEPPHIPIDPPLPDNLTQDNVLASMVQLVEHLRPPKPIPKAYIHAKVSVKERISHMKHMLKKTKQFQFHDMFSEGANRADVVVTFLALLELIKQQAVVLRQPAMFEDITIERI